MELARPRPRAGALHVGDDLGRWGERAGFAEAVGGGGELDVPVGFREEGFDLRRLRCDGGEGAAFRGAFGAWVLGGGDRFGDGFGHLRGLWLRGVGEGRAFVDRGSRHVGQGMM